MAIMDQDTRARLRARLAESLDGKVQLKLYRNAGGDCPTCEPAEELARELAEAGGDLIDLQVAEDQAEAPTLTVGQPGEEPRISFQGLPSGYEFSTLLDAVERVSKAGHELPPGAAERIGSLADDLEILVFVTPTCPYCPGAAAMAGRMALAGDRVRAVVVEANEFPKLSNRFGVQGVPQTVVNRSGSFVGALPPAAFVERVLELAGAREMA